ncbi:transposase [Candidatus Phyllobacterium onerii]|uniref:transposase n=1 Tax=Candidatus Phyllobacterium onerii TaxID=3020828 RepID=UPI00232BEAF1|nr:transposase [Phyllobacterium sp. IY22]
MTTQYIEVITSVVRRRRWSREEKEPLVAACLEPGASVSEIARTVASTAVSYSGGVRALPDISVVGPATPSGRSRRPCRPGRPCRQEYAAQIDQEHGRVRFRSNPFQGKGGRAASGRL